MQLGLRFTPHDTAPAAARATCTFNAAAVNSVQLLLRGTAHEAQLLLQDLSGSTLYFPPTCCGASSSRRVSVHNPTCVAVAWRWVLSRKLRGAVAVAPQSGEGWRGWDWRV